MLLRVLHRCPSKVLRCVSASGRRRRNAAAALSGTLLTTVLGLQLTVGWPFGVPPAPPPVYARFGVDGHSSFTHLLESDVRVSRRLPAEDVDETPDSRAAETIGVFVVLDGASSPSVGTGNSSLSLDCLRSFRYNIFVVAPVPTWTLDDSDDVRLSATAATNPEPSDKLDVVADRLRRQCVAGSPSRVDAWTVRVAVGSSSSSDVDPNDRLRSVDVPVATVADVLTEAYVDNVTWFDVVFVRRSSTSHIRSPGAHDGRPTGRGPSFGASVGRSPSGAVNASFHRTHLDVLGEAWPVDLVSVDDVAAYLSLVYSTVHVPERLVQYVMDGRHRVKRYNDAVRASAGSCLRCDLRLPPVPGQLRVISMSLYGDDPRYTVGALRNAQLLPVIFPGWRLRFYCARPPSAASALTSSASSSTSWTDLTPPPPPPTAPPYGVLPQLVDRLLDLGAEIRYVDDQDALAPMLWRFLVADDDAVDVFLSRDADSRLTERDAAAVDDWLSGRSGSCRSSTTAFHCIRDHPSHADHAVNGGMWGARRRRLLDLLRRRRRRRRRHRRLDDDAASGLTSFRSLMTGYGSEYMDDMRFIDAELWSRLTDDDDEGGSIGGGADVCCHDSVSCDRWVGAVPFAPPRQGAEHVGQVFDARSRPRQGDVDILVDVERNQICEPTERVDPVRRWRFDVRSKSDINRVAYSSVPN